MNKALLRTNSLWQEIVLIIIYHPQNPVPKAEHHKKCIAGLSHLVANDGNFLSLNPNIKSMLFYHWCTRVSPTNCGNRLNADRVKDCSYYRHAPNLLYGVSDEN